MKHALTIFSFLLLFNFSAQKFDVSLFGIIKTPIESKTNSYTNAKELVKLASDCGADAVKFQTHIAEAETLREAKMPSVTKVFLEIEE